MDQKSIYFFLAWIAIAFARPQESEELKTLCSSYFPGEPIPGLTDAIKTNFQINATTENLWKKENLTYK